MEQLRTRPPSARSPFERLRTPERRREGREWREGEAEERRDRRARSDGVTGEESGWRAEQSRAERAEQTGGAGLSNTTTRKRAGEEGARRGGGRETAQASGKRAHSSLLIPSAALKNRGQTSVARTKGVLDRVTRRMLRRRLFNLIPLLSRSNVSHAHASKTTKKPVFAGGFFPKTFCPLFLYSRRCSPLCCVSPSSLLSTPVVRRRSCRRSSPLFPQLRCALWGVVVVIRLWISAVYDRTLSQRPCLWR